MINKGESAKVLSGSCGERAKWSLDTKTGLLSILGSGKTTDYRYYSNAPWHEYRSKIKSLSIGDQITSIGDCAFSGCSGLTSVTIPNSVTKIGWSAFKNCSGLTSVTIPNSVTEIGSSAFSGCSGLTSIVVESGNTVYDSRDNCNAIIETASNTLVTGCKNTIIPNSVTSIGRFAFEDCSGLISIVVESGNRVYDSRDNCNAIIETTSNTLVTGCKNTIIPKSVTSIGESAFSGCSGLTNVTIPNSVTEIGKCAFYYCKGLTSVIIPNSVTEIGEQAFKGCSGLTNMAIPNSVTEIGKGAFDGCSGLTNVRIPNSVTSIGVNAFDDYLGILPTDSEFIDDYDYCEREQSELLNDYIPEEEISHSNYYYDDDDYDYNDGYRKYGGYNGYDDETIDAAFEGDPSLTWNCD